MYSEKVMDHFTNPRNVGEIEGASAVGTVGNAKCGDIMRIYFDIDENQVIQEVQNIRLWCRCSNKLHGNRTCKRQNHLRSNAGNKQSSYGSFRRSSTGKSSLLFTCRGSNSCSTLGLL